MPVVQPRNARQVVEVAQCTRAKGSTCPAAALRRFHSARKRIDLFIMVSDEQENQTSEGREFAELFTEYRAAVHPTAQVCACLCPSLPLPVCACLCPSLPLPVCACLCQCVRVF